MPCDDDSCGNEDLQANLTTVLTAGLRYFIYASTTSTPTAANDDIQILIEKLVTPTPPANDTCAGAIALPLNRSTAGTYSGSANDYQLAAASPCFPATVGQVASTAVGGDVAYSFTAPAAGNYSFKVWDIFTGPNPVVYTANTCPAATPGTPVTVACTAASNRSGSSEEIVCQALASGQQVFFFVDQTAASADDPFFVQVETCTAQESEPNGATASANTAACTLKGSLVPAGDVDFFDLGTPAAGSRIFALVDTASSASSHADMRVVTATDTLEYDDENNDLPWGSLGPNVAGTPATGAQTYLRISGFTPTTQADPYHLYLAVQPPIAQATAESEPNGTIGTADTAANDYFSGGLAGPAPSTDQDFYRFQAIAGDLIYIGLDSDPLRDATPINAGFVLFDSAGAVLEFTADASASGSTSNNTPSPFTLVGVTPNSPGEGLIFRAPKTGTYFVAVEIDTSSATAIGAGDYVLSISKNCSVGPSDLIFADGFE